MRALYKSNHWILIGLAILQASLAWSSTTVDLKLFRDQARAYLAPIFENAKISEDHGIWYQDGANYGVPGDTFDDHGRLLLLVRVDLDGEAAPSQGHWISYAIGLDGTTDRVAFAVDPSLYRQKTIQIGRIGKENIEGRGEFRDGTSEPDANRILASFANRFPRVNVTYFDPSLPFIFYAKPLEILKIYQFLERTPEILRIGFDSTRYPTSWAEAPVKLGDGLQSQRVDLENHRPLIDSLRAQGYCGYTTPNLPPPHGTGPTPNPHCRR